MISYSMLLFLLLTVVQGGEGPAALMPRHLSVSDSCMYRWLEANALHASRSMMRDSVMSDSLYAVLVIELQKRNMHNMTMTMLISNQVADSIREHFPGALEQMSTNQNRLISGYVTVPCQLEVWDVGYINAYDSLNARIPVAALGLMAGVDTGIQRTAYVCPLTNWTSTAIQMYHIATRASRTYHIASSPPYGGIRLDDDACALVEQFVDRITVGPFSMVLNRMLSDTIEAYRMRRPPRPKFDGPPIEFPQRKK